MDLGFFFASIIQLVVILNPVAATPIFLSITEGLRRKEKDYIAKKSATLGTMILLFFALFGKPFLSFFGISIPAIKIGGGILLFVIGMNMVYGEHKERHFPEDKDEIIAKMDDISITPVTIPLIVGPGAMTTILVLSSQADTLLLSTELCLAVFVAMGVTYIVLRSSEKIAGMISPFGMKAITKIMGLIVAAISAQLVLDGIRMFFFGA